MGGPNSLFFRSYLTCGTIGTLPSVTEKYILTSRRVDICLLHYIVTTQPEVYPFGLDGYTFLLVKQAEKNRSRKPTLKLKPKLLETFVMSKEINRLLVALEQFRAINPKMPVQQVQTFLYVCKHEGDPKGCNVKDLAVALDYSLASASRNIAAFSEVTRHKKQGPDLLEAREHFANRAYKNITLTEQGRRLRNTLQELVST